MRGDERIIHLSKGIIDIKGEFIWGSNYTFLGEVNFEGNGLLVVYKPCRGQQPLWDFPASSLPHREVAAYLVSEALRWELVPPTVYREDGPYGPGSLQLFIEHDPEYHYFSLSEEDRQRLRPVALFDYVVNNADRKGGHILFDPNNHLWVIDHGLCFHAEDKLRTVIWDFIGEEIDIRWKKDLQHLLEMLRHERKGASPLVNELRKHINNEELRAMIHRLTILLKEGIFPAPDPGRRPVPWPQL